MLSAIPQGEDYAYSLIHYIPTFEPTLQAEVRLAFADSLRAIWRVLLIFSGVGLASMVLMKGITLSAETIDERGIESSSSSSEGHEQGPGMVERRTEEGGQQGQGALLHVPATPWSKSSSSHSGRPSTGTSQKTMASQATAVTNMSTLESGMGGEGGKEGHLDVAQTHGLVKGKSRMKKPPSSWSTRTMVAIDDARSKLELEENAMTET